MYNIGCRKGLLMGRTDPPKTELWYNFLSASLRQSVATIARVIFEGSQITSVIPFRSEHDVNHPKLRPAPHFALLIRLQSGEHFILPLMICMVGGHERGISVKDRKPWDIQSLRCKPIMEKFADSPILRCQNAHVVGIGTTNYSATVRDGKREVKHHGWGEDMPQPGTLPPNSRTSPNFAGWNMCTQSTTSTMSRLNSTLADLVATNQFLSSIRSSTCLDPSISTRHQSRQCRLMSSSSRHLHLRSSLRGRQTPFPWHKIHTCR
jgi:hypothetical protein